MILNNRLNLSGKKVLILIRGQHKLIMKMRKKFGNLSISFEYAMMGNINPGHPKKKSRNKKKIFP